MAVYGLPVVDDFARVFADEVGFDFLDGRLDGERAAFEERFAESDDAGVGVYFKEYPSRFDEECFEFGDFDGCFVAFAFGGAVVFFSAGDAGEGHCAGEGEE